MKRRGYNPLGVSTLNLYGSAAFILDGIKNSIGFPRKSIANRWDDVSGKDNHLIFNRNLAFGDKYLKPVGSTWYEFNNISEALLTGSEFTFEIIASISSFARNNWLLQNRLTNASANGFQCCWVANNLRFDVLNNGVLKTTSFPYNSLNTIFHIQVTVKVGEMKLYVNNILRSTITTINSSDISALKSSTEYNIGTAENWNLSFDLTGNLYAVRIFDRLLNTSELNDHYLTDKSRFGF